MAETDGESNRNRTIADDFADEIGEAVQSSSEVNWRLAFSREAGSLQHKRNVCKACAGHGAVIVGNDLSDHLYHDFPDSHRDHDSGWSRAGSGALDVSEEEE